MNESDDCACAAWMPGPDVPVRDDRDGVFRSRTTPKLPLRPKPHPTIPDPDGWTGDCAE